MNYMKNSKVRAKKCQPNLVICEKISLNPYNFYNKSNKYFKNKKKINF